MFAGLVVDEQGRAVDVAWVGAEACYVLDDNGFRRHIDAAAVDRQVLQYLKAQVEPHQDFAVRGILQMLGKDDIFSKTAIEYSLKHMDETVGQSLPTEAQEMLRSYGFCIVIDDHGDVVAVEMPGAEETEE